MKSEECFLADRAGEARHAMAGTLRDMRGTIAKLANPRVCAQEHPWLLVGSAVAAGIVAGVSLTAARPHDAPVPSQGKPGESPPCETEPIAPHAKASWLFGTLETLLTGALSTLVQASIASAFLAAETPVPGPTSRSARAPDESAGEDARGTGAAEPT